ncbi:MAG TPA: class I SAM-dependent methyltransferase [Solirubrobacteraceae bacterium]|nr:class I SAM-dependent methyltransferase [Solirubrobacteraceae bacterium]
MSATKSAADEVATLKEAHRAMWADGDYSAVARLMEEVPAHMLSSVGVDAHHRVLDVATGTGNVALRAARSGAQVTGIDLTPELLEVAAVRAAALGAEVEWVQGDAEALPFPDQSFDRVLSAFGIQFAPRHEITARELVRVCRPGGAIALANWTPEGIIGQQFAILGRYLPTPPAFASPPPLWGSEEHVRELLSAWDVELEFERAVMAYTFGSAEELLQFYETNYGPTIRAKARLESEGRWGDCRAELADLFLSQNRATDDADLRIEAEYLLIVVRPR